VPLGWSGRSNSGCRSRSGSPSAITAANAAGERSVASRNAARDAPGVAGDVDPPRAGSDRPAPGHRLAHVLALGADPQMPRRGAATQPDLAVVQHRRAGRDRPYPSRAPTWCGVNVRGSSSRLRMAIRPYPSEPTAPIRT